MAIKNIIFDFGEVLIDWNPKYLYRHFFSSEEDIERFLEEIDFHAMNYKMDGGLTFAEFVAVLSERHPHYAEQIAAYQSRWVETLGAANQPVVDILSRYRESRKYRLFGLTNWAAETFPIGRSKFEFLNWFEDIVISGVEGLAKPEPQIYRLLLKRNRLAAAECLFIDDRPENIEAAVGLGITGVVYRSAEQLTEELQKLGVL